MPLACQNLHVNMCSWQKPLCQYPSCHHVNTLHANMPKTFNQVKMSKTCQQLSCQHLHVNISSCQNPACHQNKTLHANMPKPFSCQDVKNTPTPSCQYFFMPKPCMPSKQNPSCQHAETFFMSRCEEHAKNFHTIMPKPLYAKYAPCHHVNTLHANMPRPISSQDVKNHDDNKLSCQNLHVNFLSCQNPLLRITFMPSCQNPSCQHAETFFMSRCLLLWNIVGQQIKHIY